METENKTRKRNYSRRKKNDVIDVIHNGDVIGGVSDKKAEEKQPIQKTGDTVSVCLNFPRDVKFFVPDKNGTKTAIVFNGNAGNIRGKDRGIIPTGAYGITLGVPREAWEWILANYKDNELIKKGLLFSPHTKNIRLEVEERTSLRHGFEPVDMSKTTVSKPYAG